VLRRAIALSLVGHGGIALSTPERWMVYLAALGTSPATPGGLAALTGTAWLEIALGAAIVATRDRTRGLLVLVCSWRIATEALRIPADEAIWEFIERGGAYAAPVLVSLLERADTTDPGASSRRETTAREESTCLTVSPITGSRSSASWALASPSVPPKAISPATSSPRTTES
jgi:hypothetical protein